VEKVFCIATRYIGKISHAELVEDPGVPFLELLPRGIDQPAKKQDRAAAIVAN
jgi:hypothetical protein